MYAITRSARQCDLNPNWYVIDAKNQVLGRLASLIASHLKGKHKPIYTPHLDTGDYIVVINARHIRLTGKKMADKLYHSHSGYPGGLKTLTLKQLFQRDATRPLYFAVKRMLPRNPLGRAMLKKLKIYSEGDHPHVAQQPKVLDLHHLHSEVKQ